MAYAASRNMELHRFYSDCKLEARHKPAYYIRVCKFRTNSVDHILRRFVNGPCTNLLGTPMWWTTVIRMSVSTPKFFAVFIFKHDPMKDNQEQF